MAAHESPNFALYFGGNFRMDLAVPMRHLQAAISESFKPLSLFPKRAILPCEIKSREFDSKLLLACFLAERGWTSVVGSRNDIHLKLHRIRRSVYLGKDVRFSSGTIITMLRLLGHRFDAMDEEAQFFPSRERYRKSRVDGYVLSHAEVLYAWGPENALAWKEAPTYKGQPIHLTGNGRIDLLRPETRGLYAARRDELKARYGDFILVNTNFSTTNHFFGNLSINVSEDDEEPATRAHANGYLLHRQRLFQAFVDLMPKLARQFPKTKIILRPHPGENHDAWRDVVKNNPNVEINSEGSVVPWILASRALVHNGCTTALEAYVLGGTAITYQPHVSAEFDSRLPNELSLSAKSTDELFALLKQALNGKISGRDLHTEARRQILAQYVAAEEGDLATERMAGLMDALSSQAIASNTNIMTWPVGAAIVLGRALLKRYHSNRRGHKSNIIYTRHRFPHTDVSEVQLRIADFAGCLGRFSGVTAHQLDENIFEVQNPLNSDGTKHWP
jgi:surface carbohydrate biosynthesis protein